MRQNLIRICTSVSLLFLFFSSSPAFSADYHVAGCGLGSLVVKENKMVWQLIAATLNGTGIQTFGITTGTSNCKTDGLVKQDKVQEVFIAVNFSVLEQEIAAGQGEKLSALSSLLGCPVDQTVRFSKLTQNNYSKFFAGNPTPSSMLSGVKEEIGLDAVLSAACKI
ncbi:DUF3015 family protein [Leptospira yasudae]|uniref:DUF3015 domain-containing protein n=1 Tax=Leptospira yasudae TaxID=2202201 RepID=A0ABX9LY25_9LEPT|nr:DUF3015 family protein [Leptospira yasudae]RHX77765.1 hypothetical protein DLM77_20130 [Leptospira yasudae]